MSREYFTIYPKKFYEKIDNTHIWILGIFFSLQIKPILK